MDNSYLAPKIKMARMRQDFLLSRGKAVPDEIAIVAAMDYEQAVADDLDKAKQGRKSSRMISKVNILAAKLYITISEKRDPEKITDADRQRLEQQKRIAALDIDKYEKAYHEQLRLEEKEIQEEWEFRDINGLAHILEEEGFGEAADVVLTWFGIDHQYL